MEKYTLVNRFTERYRIGGASKSEIKGYVNFGDREVVVEE
jgi:hypothetical protein